MPSRQPTSPPDTATAASPGIAGRVRSWGIDFWFPVVLLVGLLLLSALSISGSSTAAWSESGRPADTIVGNPRGIRSDEWIATTPMKTGRVRAGFPTTEVFGLAPVDLADSWRPQFPSRSLPAAIYSPYNLPLVVLPLEQGFAMYFWLPFVACALGVHCWLRLLGVTRGVALAASLLVTVSPIVVWWSGWPAQSIANAVIPCAFVVGAAQLMTRRRGWAVAVAVVGGISAAGLPWWYQPWGIPTALFAAGVTLCWGLGRRERRRSFLTAGVIAGAVFGIESIVYYLHEKSYYEALAATAYPGKRRELGGGVSLGKLMTGLFPFELASSQGDAIVSENLSEIAMGWTVVMAVAAAATALARRAVKASSERVLLVGTVAIGVFLSAWAIIRWPSVVGRVTLLTFSPATRVAPFIGFFGIVSLALLLATPERRARVRADLGRSGVAALGVGTLVLALWGATEFRLHFLPGLSDLRVYAAAGLVSAFVVLLFTKWWKPALFVGTALAVLSGVIVNPLVHGLGELESSAAAAAIRTIDDRVVQPADGTWAADTLYANGLLNAQGVNSLSSYNDPVHKSAWRELDPGGKAENTWNRFGYIMFDWSPGLAEPEISAPYGDQIRVAVDPCDPKLDALHLRMVVSSRPLDGAPCLTPDRELEWMGAGYTLYRREPVGG